MQMFNVTENPNETTHSEDTLLIGSMKLWPSIRMVIMNLCFIA